MHNVANSRLRYPDGGILFNLILLNQTALLPWKNEWREEKMNESENIKTNNTYSAVAILPYTSLFILSEAWWFQHDQQHQQHTTDFDRVLAG